jgi:hypothetical protein
MFIKKWLESQFYNKFEELPEKKKENIGFTRDKSNLK